MSPLISEEQKISGIFALQPKGNPLSGPLDIRKQKVSEEGALQDTELNAERVSAFN